jgi:hypothetical protein
MSTGNLLIEMQREKDMRGKKKTRTEHSLLYNSKRNKICIVGKERNTEYAFEIIITMKLPKLVTDTRRQIWEAQRTPKNIKTTTKKSMYSHVISKMLVVGGGHLTYTGIRVSISGFP